MKLRFALGQMVCRLGDTAANIDTACALSRTAAAAGARLIVLPEGCLTGNALSGPERQAVLPADREAFAPLSEAATAGGITICAGFITRFEARFNTVHAIIEPGGSVRFQRKAYRASTEPLFLEPWPNPARAVFTVDGLRAAIAICSETSAPRVREALHALAPDLLLHPSAGCMKLEQVWREDAPPTPEALGFAEECRSVVRGAAEVAGRTRQPKLSANPVGWDGETWWPGNCYAVDAAGRVVLEIPGENRPARMVSTVAVGEIDIGPA